MNQFEEYIAEVRKLIALGNDTVLLKRLVDLSLDTDELHFFKKCAHLLIKGKEGLTGDRKEAVEEFLEELITYLKELPIEEKKTLVEATNLKKRYNTGFELGPVSVLLREGEILGLVGENGNGKTTLLRTLCGELRLTDGTIRYHFEASDLYELRTQLVYIPQRTISWKGSLLSNLRFTAASYGILGEKNLYLVDLIILRMGLGEYREMDWKSLSSGYKMRFELARMLLRKPKILVIDEPLANLDILAQQLVLDDFRDLTRSLFRPLGVILSSQQLYAVEKTSDEVLFLHQGKPRSFKEELNGEEEVSRSEFVIEFECDMDQEQIQRVFGRLGMQKLELNGGTYVAFFAGPVTGKDFLQLAIQQDVELKYFRNITQSTRRFFLNE